MDPPKDAAANRERERDLRDRIFKDRDTRDSKEIRDNRDPRERHYESRRRSRSPRERSYREYSSRGGDRDRERPRERERDRSRDRGRDRSRDRDLSATSVLPLDEWPRKLKHWDVPPLGFEGMSAMQVKATGLFIPASAQPKVTNLTPFSEAQSRTFASSTINTDDQGASGTSSKLVLTGYPSHFSEGDITYLMNDLMKSYGFSNSTSEGKAVKSVRKSEKEAFIEFETAEQSSQALVFDGYVHDNVVLRVRRLQETSNSSTTNSSNNNPHVISPHVDDTPHKLFIGCIPFSLSDSDLIEILQSFGTLQSFYLVRDNMTGQSKGYAFCAYQDPLVTDTAVAGLHQFELLDKKLVVQRASQGKASLSGGGNHHGSSSSEFVVGSYGIQANVSSYGTAAAHLLPALLKSTSANGNSVQPRASTVIQVMNVWDSKLESPDSVHEDFQSECQKFGKIEEILVAGPHTAVGLNIPTHTWGKVFIRFNTKAVAATALDALAGLRYGESTLITAYFDEALFEQKSFVD